MKFAKYIFALLTASMILPAVAGCCGGCCGRRRPANRQGRKTVQRPAPRGRICRGGHCR